MSKWRPTDFECLYVIPDVHGAVNLLRKILDRILPLRKSDGFKDKLVFLGDYIDRDINSCNTIELLIKLKEKYKDQVIFVKGNHEQMMLMSFGLDDVQIPVQEQERIFEVWKANGGIHTIAGYYNKANKISDAKTIPREALSMPRTRVLDIVPKSHIDFLKSLHNYYEFDNYVFVHAGCDPNLDMDKQSHDVLFWNRGLFQYAKSGNELNWEQVIVTGHNGPEPLVREKFMMLDAGSPSKLLVAELRSLEAFTASPKHKRLVSFKFKGL